MTRRPLTSLGLALVLAWASLSPTGSSGQQSPLPRVAWVLIAAELNQAGWKAFQEGLAESGFRDGKNVKIEMRFLAGHPERYGQEFVDLKRQPVAVFMAAGLQGIDAARKASDGKPVLAYFCGNDVRQMVETFARPGGNVTGVACLSDELAIKRAELLVEAFPDRRRIAFLYNPDVPAKERERVEIEQALARLGRSAIAAPVSKAGQIDSTIEVLVRQGVDALVVAEDLFTYANMQAIAASAARHRVPGVFAYREFASSGGALSYGPSFLERSRQYGRYLGRLLAGTSPADLPIDEPTRFELVVNANAARAMGAALSPAILGRADEVID